MRFKNFHLKSHQHITAQKITSVFLLAAPSTQAVQHSGLALSILCRKFPSSSQQHAGSHSQPHTAPSKALGCCHPTLTAAWRLCATVPAPHLNPRRSHGRPPGAEGHSAPPGPRTAPTCPLCHTDLPVSRDCRRRGSSTREGGRNARPRATLPTCCHLWTKTAPRMRAAACTGAESRAPMQYVRSCATACVRARRVCKAAAPEHAHCRRRRAGQRST